jgi:hypothetical protein
VFSDDEPVQFRIKTDSEAELSAINYDDKKIFGQKIPEGESTVEMGKLPRDHYTLTVNSHERSEETHFAVIPSIESRPELQDSAIASDLATSWLVKPEQFESLAHLTKLAGIIWVRDRIRWRELETQRDEWAERTRYDDSAETQTKHGLKVYQVFHNTPDWAQKESKSHSFPDDLRDAYNFAVQMARRFDGKVLAWELWNEPDISVFSNELGDAYAALAKTMYLGFKSADPDLPILICSFAHGPGKFAEMVFQNDIQNYFDIYNYHIYDKWENHIDRALKHIALMGRYGVEDKPIWLTEAGRAVRREDDLVEVTMEQGRQVADFLPKAIVSSLSAGVDKYFWFILPYYRENDFMLFGLLHQDMTPTPGYCALSTCTYALGKGDYLGKIEVEKIHAHAFDRGDDKTAVAFWADEGEQPFELRVPGEKAKLINLMGSEQEIDINDGILKLNADSHVKYLLLPENSLVAELKMDYPKEKPELKPYDPGRISPIVLRLQFPAESKDKKSETYLLPSDSKTEVALEIYNFGNDKFNCKLNLQMPQGWDDKLDNDKAEIAPMDRIVRKLEITPTESIKPEPDLIRIDALNSTGKTETFIIAQMGGNSEDKSDSEVKIYPQPGDEAPSEDYSVSVNGKPVFVYKARVSAMPFNQVWPGYQRPMDQTELASFAYWDMSGSATVEVVSNRAVKYVDIRPKSHGIKPSIEGNKITFRMPKPGYATVEVNGIHHALHLFVSPIEENTPKPDAPGVRYFGPGVHKPGKIELKSDETVYIAGGSIVHGVITSSGTSNISILGRGILDTSTFKRQGNPGPISLLKCHNIRIEGIIIRDSNVWAVTPRDCENLAISNIKLIGFWRYNADGIDIVNSRHVTIDDCFVRSFDDSIVIKGLRGTGEKPVKDVVVNNCVIWNDWGRAFEIGAETVAPEIIYIVFKNCDIIHTVHIAMDIQHGDRALVQDVVFENIRFEIEDNPLLPKYQSSRDEKYVVTEQDKYCPQLFVLIIRENNYSHDKERGHIRNVLFKDISVIGKCFPRSYFVGYDSEHQVKDVRIENLRINGKRITSIDEGRIKIGDHVENVEFVNSQ